ncbi:MAG TPA: DsbA family protein [Hyphomicrobiaceae bacterium]|nr:DsbA family protein [Hyphomicrobiaceae bacterium]
MADARTESETDAPAKVAGRQLVYFADPMCSWCYGFSPVIGEIARRFEGRMPVRIVMGGLRAGNERPMRDADRDYIRSAWTRVAAASGQPFDHAFFERESFVYDTEPACRSVVTMRRRAPERALEFLTRVSRAFYAENRDTTKASELAKLAAEFGEDADAFELAMLDPEMRNATLRDFLLAQQSGVSGFPCLVAGREADGYALVTSGFATLDTLIEPIETWYAGQA